MANTIQKEEGKDCEVEFGCNWEPRHEDGLHWTLNGVLLCLYECDAYPIGILMSRIHE